MAGWLGGLVSEWVGGWGNQWMHEWVGGWVSEWVTVTENLYNKGYDVY